MALVGKSGKNHKLTYNRLDSFSTQGHLGRDRFLDYSFVPPGIERSSAEGDLSLLMPAQRRELDRVFFGDLWEADHYQVEGDPAFSLTLQARVEAHIHKHRSDKYLHVFATHSAAC